MRWYSLKCFLSSFWFFGGNQLGLVLLKTISFSLLIGRGSIITLFILSGGSSTVLDFDLDNFSLLGLGMNSPP